MEARENKAGKAFRMNSLQYLGIVRLRIVAARLVGVTPGVIRTVFMEV